MKSISIITTILLLFQVSYAQKITKTQRAQLDQITYKDVPKGAPGIAVGIVQNGKIVYENYAGYANLEDSLQIGKDTRFNIASTGKQFTAFAILTLVETKQLRIEDDLRTYLPDVFKNNSNSIKIKHLLNHSSGIRDVYDLWSLQGFTWWKETFDNAAAMELLRKQTDLNFTPGSMHSYSNSNYILLTEIIEKVTGKSFVAYTNELFQKLGMRNTSFVSDYTNIAEPIAKPYFNFSTWTTYDWTCNIHGDGNLFTTLEDQLIWEKMLQTKKSTAFSKELLEKSQQPISNTTIKNYGYGLEFGTYKDIPYRFHSGATGAWKAYTARFPTKDISVVVMINSGKIDITSQTLQTADVILGKNAEKETFLIAPEKIGAKVSIQDVLGIYRTDGGYVMKFEERNGDLYLIRNGRNDMKLFREADNVFQQWNDPTFKQEFTKNSDGTLQITAYYPTVKPFTATRIENDLSNFTHDLLNGTFKNTETGVSVTVAHQQGNEYQIEFGTKKLKGILIYDNEILLDNYRVFFSKNDKGMIDELFVTSGRIQNVRFTRK